ncbi:MAG TPA: secondary thiamine-phosphate synthase enzyme YjbQ [Acidobacteriota bacterium]
MSTFRTTLERDTTPDTDVHDLTAEVVAAVSESGVTDGLVVIFTPGSTAAITTIEFESGAVADLTRAIAALAPTGAHYDHDARWGDGNGYSHVRAALLGPSLAVPVIDGRPALGTWQQVVLCDFDNRPRRRKVIVQVSG